MNAVINKIENNIAVLEFESGEMVEMPLSLFDFTVTPQMMISIKFERDTTGENKLRKEIKELRKKIL
jgi:hypothetical protein